MLIKYKLALDPEPFWEDFADEEVDKTLEQIIGNLTHSIIANKEKIDQKANWVDKIFILSFIILGLLPIQLIILILSLYVC